MHCTSLSRAGGTRAHPVLRLIRFTAYGPLFLLTGLFGALLTLAPIDGKIIVLELFIATSASFGFVLNDISDRTLDANEPNPRNPLADGTCPLTSAYVVCGLLLVVSLICLLLLPLPLIILGGLELFIFATYSVGIEVKNIAGPDLAYHGLFPGLYAVMGYMLYGSPDWTGALFFVLVVIFGAVAEIFNEIRDLEKDRLVRKNFVIVAGKKRAFMLTLVLLAAALCTTALFALFHPPFYWLLVFIPSGLLLMHPVWRAMHDPRYEPMFVPAINCRAIAITLAMVAVFAVLRL
ncbi:MAG: UbiA family prenyltransferase [Methanoregula sp.]|nr:MAG: UbiA family prenyltransferase [Methanoregula sp.]